MDVVLDHNSFSKELIHLSHLKKFRLISDMPNIPTNEGHGSLVKCTNKNIVYDMRMLDQSLFGHSHPLSIRSRHSSIEAKQVLKLALYPLMQSMFVQKKCSYFSNLRIMIDELREQFDELWIVGDNELCDESSHDFLLNQKKAKCILLILSPSLEMDELIQHAKHCSDTFILIENNCLGSGPHLFYFQNLQVMPDIFAANIVNQGFCVWSTNNITQSASFNAQEVLENYYFLKFLSEANILGPTGRLSQIAQELKNNIKNQQIHLQGNIFYAHRNFLETLTMKGLLATQDKHATVGRLPVSILSKQVEEICAILNSL